MFDVVLCSVVVFVEFLCFCSLCCSLICMLYFSRLFVCSPSLLLVCALFCLVLVHMHSSLVLHCTFVLQYQLGRFTEFHQSHSGCSYQWWLWVIRAWLRSPFSISSCTKRLSQRSRTWSFGVLGFCLLGAQERAQQISKTVIWSPRNLIW